MFSFSTFILSKTRGHLRFLDLLDPYRRISMHSIISTKPAPFGARDDLIMKRTSTQSECAYCCGLMSMRYTAAPLQQNLQCVIFIAKADKLTKVGSFGSHPSFVATMHHSN